MTQIPIGVPGAACSPVSDDAYPNVLASILGRASSRCLCSLFIIDTTGSSSAFITVLEALEDARWQGADARVLIGGSRLNYLIAERSASARSVLQARAIPCRWMTATETRGSHAKFVVADDIVLLGSHNWSPGAFTGQVQDSLLIDSPHLAAYLAGVFDEQWARAGTG